MTSSSFWNFLKMNSFVGGLGLVSAFVLDYFDFNFPAVILIETFQTIVLIGTLEQTNKILIHPKNKVTLNRDIVETVALTTTIKAITHYVISSGLSGYSFNPVSFVLKSFVFEISFDFIHYWMHRMAHTSVLYRWTHKTHHHYQHPSAYTAYYSNPLDVLMTFSIPMGVLYCLFPHNFFSATEFTVLTTYVSFQEIAGHLGKHMSPASSFIQFKWLPKYLDIELYTEDHDLHHTHFIYNFSKRFVIWDKFFGTFHRQL